MLGRPSHPKKSSEIESLASRTSSAALQLRSAQNDKRCGSLTDSCSFRGQRTGSGTISTCFTEQLADHVFYRHFLHVYVADVAGLEKFPAGFRNLCAWNLQLYRDRCLFGDFAKRRQIARSFLFESKTKNLIA